MAVKLLHICAVVVLVLGLVAPAGAAIPPAPWNPYFASPAVIYDYESTPDNARPFGIAAGDFDGDGIVDIVTGRYTGMMDFLKGTGPGAFAPPVPIGFRQTTWNASALAAGDLNGDGKLDIVWGANTTHGTLPEVNDGDVRVYFGNDDGTFVTNTYTATIVAAAGTLVGDIGTADAGSLAVGDVDGDGDQDVIAGAIDGTNTVVKLLRNDGSTPFTIVPLISQSTSTALQAPIYWPAISPQNSPWGLALGDADADGDLDLWVGDRSLYVYLYRNDGSGAFTMQTGNDALGTRPNAYLVHETYRASTTPTPALGSGDINGDGRADLVLGLQSGGHSTPVAHDGEILLDISEGTGHTGMGAMADIGMVARGVTVIDATGDGYLDIIAGEYSGKIVLLRQLPPLDTDGDGISDYVDNAPHHANAPRLDMNTDLSVNQRDQLDNDFDTVLGNPEDPGTWQRLGDVADVDDDNDSVPDSLDNCLFVANAAQADVDQDGAGDACDPLDDRDADGDGVTDGPGRADSLFAPAMAARAKWSSGTQHFVVRIDALGRWFQNEFTQIMTDAATLSPADWALKCWENYGMGDNPDPAYEPCGTGQGTITETLTLPGGKGVPVSLVVIPKQLWTDPEVVSWINDRNDSPALEIVQHGTYHTSNVPVSDWNEMPDRNFYSCETCGLTEAESFEFLKVGQDTLLGNYQNKWVAESIAITSPVKIDWSTSANPLISFSPPYNASDTMARQAVAQLGYRSFSASKFEEQGPLGAIFSPEGSYHLQFDQFGMFHAGADLQLSPPDTHNGSYNATLFENYLSANVNPDGLTVWLIEEVDWSGRPCNDLDRLGTCEGSSNRENNTVYDGRWNAWMQLLDFVKAYPDSVTMTLGEVALAKGSDNAPTAANADQADGDHDGIGDVIDGATLAAFPATLLRSAPGQLTALLENGAGAPIAGQALTFKFDAGGDGVVEEYPATTGANGRASVTVTATLIASNSLFSVEWDGVVLQAAASAEVTILAGSSLALAPANPVAGQVTDPVTVTAALKGAGDVPLAGQTVTFTIGSAAASGITDEAGNVTGTLTLAGPAGPVLLRAGFAGDAAHGPAAAESAFLVQKEDASLAYTGDIWIAAGAPVLLSVQVNEVDDGTPGDISLASVRFELARTGTSVQFSFGPAPVAASGIATWSLAGGLERGTYEVVVVADPGNGFYRATPATAVDLVIYSPVLLPLILR